MPTANYDSSYRFTTSEQLRQDLKKALRDRKQSVNAFSQELGIPQASASGFLLGRTADAGKYLTTYITWLNSVLPPSQPSTPLAAWLTLQSCLLDVVGRTGELPPDALDAIFMLNKYFARAAQESNHD